MDIEEAIANGVAGIRARRALIRVERERLDIEDERLKIAEAELVAYETNTQKRHMLEGYDERIRRAIEDVRDDPAAREFLPDRIGVISRDYKVRVEAVKADIGVTL